MARKNIELGVIPSGQGGDTFRSAMIKVNDMTAELYTAIEDGGGKVQTVAGVDPDAAGDIPKAQLATALGVDDKVDKVAGKGLSSNDFTTTEKTKLSTLVNPASYGVGGPAPLVDNIYQVKDGGITYWNQATTGRPPTGVQGNLISMTGGLNGSASTFIATSLDEDKVFFSRVNGSTRAPWKQFVLQGDYGVGAMDNAPFVGLAQNPDLYRTGGTYFGQFNVTPAGTVTGFLTVSAGSGPSACAQSFHESSSNRTYKRIQEGGTWSTWERTFVETITNANGTAIKFPDGTAICWFSKGPTITTVTAIGSGFQSAAVTRYTYPISFVGGVESISIAPHVMYVSGPSQAWCTLSSKTTTYCDVIALGFQSGIEVRTGFLAIGRWKA